MTTYTLTFQNCLYTLSTEHSACCYGAAVLIDGAGCTYGPSEIVIPAETEGSSDGIFAPRPAITARDVVGEGKYLAATNDDDAGKSSYAMRLRFMGGS